MRSGGQISTPRVTPSAMRGMAVVTETMIINTGVKHAEGAANRELAAIGKAGSGLRGHLAQITERGRA
jgi:pyrimidine deaminase RibD-like protein